MIDKPVPELDERISVLLFNTAVTDYYSQVGPYAIASKEAAKSYNMDYPNGPEIPVVPDYSTTWNGMQLVVEEMQRRGWEVALESMVDVFHARVFKRFEGDYAEFESEHSFPHAVCIAALKALEDSQNE